jgi:hypothetical protein
MTALPCSSITDQPLPDSDAFDRHIRSDDLHKQSQASSNRYDRFDRCSACPCPSSRFGQSDEGIIIQYHYYLQRTEIVIAMWPLIAWEARKQDIGRRVCTSRTSGSARQFSAMGVFQAIPVQCEVEFGTGYLLHIIVSQSRPNIDFKGSLPLTDSHIPFFDQIPQFYPRSCSHRARSSVAKHHDRLCDRRAFR